MKAKTLFLAALAGAFIWTLIIIVLISITTPDTPPLPAGPVTTQSSLRV